jgi:hypothetical protein
VEPPAGESDNGSLPVDFDRRLQLKFHGSRSTSDAGLLAYCELDDVLGLTDLAGGVFSDHRRGKNTATGLARLRRGQARNTETRDLLAPSTAGSPRI